MCRLNMGISFGPLVPHMAKWMGEGERSWGEGDAKGQKLPSYCWAVKAGEAGAKRVAYLNARELRFIRWHVDHHPIHATWQWTHPLPLRLSKGWLVRRKWPPNYDTFIL